jgi:hypothetical protein
MDQVHAAAATALTARRRGEMTTRNVHTEMIFCMSPNRNIKASLDQFGAGDATTDLLLAAFELDDGALSAFSSSSSVPSSTKDEFAAACSSVEGQRADPSALGERCNVAQICKVRARHQHQFIWPSSSAEPTLNHSYHVFSSRSRAFITRVPAIQDCQRRAGIRRRPRAGPGRRGTRGDERFCMRRKP